MSYWYLATPYRQWGGGLDDAYKMASEQAAILVKEGVPTFCPIAHSHSIAKYGNIHATDNEFWMKVDEPMMESAIGLVVVTANGWINSKGIRHEIEFFQHRGRPVIFMERDKFPEQLRQMELERTLQV